MTWSELIRPPRLQHSETDKGKQRTATWLELFFDLAFVLVVGEQVFTEAGTTSAPTTPVTCRTGRPPSRGWSLRICRRTRRSWTLSRCCGPT
jgi:hypothetical protein